MLFIICCALSYVHYFYALYSMHCILCIVLYTMYSMHCNLWIFFYELHYMHWFLCIVSYALHYLDCILCIVFYALYSIHCILRHAKRWNSSPSRFSGQYFRLLGKLKPLSRTVEFPPISWKFLLVLLGF